jgi:hypothetical protein
MPEEQPTHVIYAGKTITGLLTQGTIYKLPFPPHIQAELTARPALKGFFTTPEKFLHHTRLMGVKHGALTLPTGRYINRKGAK